MTEKKDLFLDAAKKPAKEVPHGDPEVIQMIEGAAEVYEGLLDEYGYDKVSEVFEDLKDAPEVLDEQTMFRLEEAIKRSLILCPTCRKPTDYVSVAGVGLQCSLCDNKFDGAAPSEGTGAHGPTDGGKDWVKPVPFDRKSGRVSWRCPICDDAYHEEANAQSCIKRHREPLAVKEAPEPDPEAEREERDRRATEAETVARAQGEYLAEPPEPDMRAFFIRSGELVRTIGAYDDEISELADELKSRRKSREETVVELLALRRGMSEPLPLFDRVPEGAEGARASDEGGPVGAPTREEIGAREPGPDLALCVELAKRIEKHANLDTDLDGESVAAIVAGGDAEVMRGGMRSRLSLFNGALILHYIDEDDEVTGTVYLEDPTTVTMELEVAVETTPDPAIEDPGFVLGDFRFTQSKVLAYAGVLAATYGERRVVWTLLATEAFNPDGEKKKIRKPDLEAVEETLGAENRKSDEEPEHETT